MGDVRLALVQLSHTVTGYDLAMGVFFSNCFDLKSFSIFRKSMKNHLKCFFILCSTTKIDRVIQIFLFYFSLLKSVQKGDFL